MCTVDITHNPGVAMIQPTEPLEPLHGGDCTVLTMMAISIMIMSVKTHKGGADVGFLSVFPFL